MCWVDVHSSSEGTMERGNAMIPPPPDVERYPRLLTENDVIYSVDYKRQFVRVGHGAFADVYLGEIRQTGSRVVIKCFRDSDVSDIMEEVRIHRYVEQSIRTPRIIGLLPSGPLSSNISLVYEYVPRSKTLSDWLDKGPTFTNVQWVYVCLEIATNLQRLHDIHVLHNDLHDGNILIQRPKSCCVRSLPTVSVLDFGSATYKHGKVFSGAYESLKSYRFLAPELMKDTQLKPQRANICASRISKSKSWGNGDHVGDISNDKIGNVQHEIAYRSILTIPAKSIDEKWTYDKFLNVSKECTHHSKEKMDLRCFKKREKTSQNVGCHGQKIARKTGSTPTSTRKRPATSRATDVFTLGHVLEGVARHTDLAQLRHLSLWCQASDPAHRPVMLQVLSKLEQMLIELRLIEHSRNKGPCSHGCGCNSLHEYGDYGVECSPFSSFFNHNKNLNNREKFSPSSTDDGICSSYPVKKSGRVNLEDRSLPIKLVDPKDIQPLKAEALGKEWLSYSKNDAIRLVLLKPTQRLVIVKEFYDTEFGVVRHELCVTQHIAAMGFAPKIIGMLIEYKNMSDVAFVQERFGAGVTLSKFVERTRLIEWDRNVINQTIVGESQKRKIDVVTDMEETCFLKEHFLFLTGGHASCSVCSQKSHRQSALEDIIRKVAIMLDAIHQSELLVNNLHSSNILLGFERDAIKVKFIDLGRVTPLDEGIELGDAPKELSSYHYIAPELTHGKASTISSDGYSLCIIILDSIGSYFPKYHITLERRPEHATNHNKPGKARDVDTVFREYNHPKHLRVCHDNPDSHRLDKLQKLLLRCVYGEPSERPSVKELFKYL